MPFYRLDRNGTRLGFGTNMPQPLIVSILDYKMEEEGRTTAALMEGFGYLDEKEKLAIEAPIEFRTDFASIPYLARAIISPFGRHAKAAVLHDWLYAIGEPGRKPVADNVFRHAMKELKVAPWRIWVMYMAVHFFGGKGYANAARDWPNTFANGNTGEVTPYPPFERETAFLNQPNGPKSIP